MTAATGAVVGTVGDMTTDAMIDRSRLHPKANEALDQNLAPGERIHLIITGPSAQAIVGTDRRVFVYKKGFMAGASFGAELTSWDYRNLVGVQLHTGMMSGAVVLQAPGQSGTRTNVWKRVKMTRIRLQTPSRSTDPTTRQRRASPGSGS